MTKINWERIKWLANICFIVSTVLMLSPKIAATSCVPWAIFLVGNLVWGIDSARTKNYPWLTLAVFFGIWDSLIFTARLYNIEILEYITPITQIVESFI